MTRREFGAVYATRNDMGRVPGTGSEGPFGVAKTVDAHDLVTRFPTRT